MPKILMVLVFLIAFPGVAICETSAQPLATGPAAEIPINQPNMDKATIVSWVAINMSEAMTFGSDNYPERLSKSARLFTKQGWEVFSDALRRSGAIDTVAMGNARIVAEPEMSPVLIQEGARAGIWRWVLTMPLTVHHKGTEHDHDEIMQFSLVVERAPATRNNPDGIAITQAALSVPESVAKERMSTGGASKVAIPEYPSMPVGQIPASPMVQPDMPVDAPDMDDDQLTLWAAAAATRAATFGFTDRDMVFKNAQRDFTPDGWKSFQAALRDPKIFGDIDKYKLILTSAPIGKPVVLRKQVENGRYQWTVKFTLVQTNRESCQKSINHVPITLRIVRTPVAQNPFGVAIDRWDGDIRSTDFSGARPCYISSPKIEY
jgi:hypothetical protein